MKKLTALWPLPLLAALSACGGGNDMAAQSQDSGAPRLAAATVSSSVDYSATVQQIYLAYFGRAADTGGLASFSAQMTALGAPADLQKLIVAYATDPNIRKLVDSFGSSSESQALYTGDTRAFITAIYKNIFNRDPDLAGLAFWANAIDSGALTRGAASLSILAGALTNTSNQGMIDARVIDKKVQLSKLFSSTLLARSIEGYRGDRAATLVRLMLSQISENSDSALFQTVVDANLKLLSATCGIVGCP